MDISKHMPREVGKLYPSCEEMTREIGTGFKLLLPKRVSEKCPVIVRITAGEDVSLETACFNEAGFAVYLCFADQQSMERDVQACAAWQKTLEEHLDALIAANPVLDETKIFLDGWMTAWIIFHTNRFRAAAQSPALLHQATAYGNCAAGEAVFSNGLLVDQMKELAAGSVLAHVDNCKTPCLVLYQEGNARYSREQSEQLYAAMKDRNSDIPCRMVVLPNNLYCDWKQVCLEELLNWWNRFRNGEETAR